MAVSEEGCSGMTSGTFDVSVDEAINGYAFLISHATLILCLLVASCLNLSRSRMPCLCGTAEEFGSTRLTGMGEHPMNDHLFILVPVVFT